ncbi:hypothetical protein ACN2XU_19690 [Primorskyibacter sp. 2E107]|uniref:hypothetical protein n=1 Tax=Primorskyibacter sp. 2E107 TaxID=3403458 RepID=UPI003AF8DE12
MINPVIDVLMAGVPGGISHPIGSRAGASAYTAVDNFAVDFIARERFKMLIGIIFLWIVLFSPDGIAGLTDRLRKRLWRKREPKTSPMPPDAPAPHKPTNGGH